MENFIQKIFDIDENAENYQRDLEIKKQKLLNDRKEKLKCIDDEYFKVLEEEKENLSLRLESIEKEDFKKLESYNRKSIETKNIFMDKKETLVKNFANSILESGELYGE